jgi:glycosyltransferase involved in cell wall biosynthesis
MEVSMKNRNVKELSIVIPAKDEENSIGQVLEEINVVNSISE